MTVSLLSGVGRGALWARLESPRGHYATPDLATEATRAPRRRQLPTNHGHVALPCGVIHVYQSDSSSKPPHRQPRAGALRNSLTQIRGPSSATRKKPLDVGPSISVSRPPSRVKRPPAYGAGADGHARQGSRDHAACVRCSVAAGLHQGARGPSPVGGNGSPCRTRPSALRGASAAVVDMTLQTGH